MEKIYEMKAYILNFYTKYSRYIDLAMKFLLAVLTFAFISNHVGFMKTLANPLVTIGLSIVCMFLPIVMTAIFASVIVLIQFFSLAPGAAMVSAVLLLVMFALYFRFASGNSVLLLLTPIAFSLNIPVLIPIVYGLSGNPLCAIPIAFGIIVYYLISYVKSYAAVIETVAESGVVAQITTFTQQLFSTKEMWLIIISFTVCLLLVYNIKRLAVDHAWEIAIVAGVLGNAILVSFGHVMLNIEVSYSALFIGSVITIIVALIVEIFVFSVDYTRTEYLQFEDDEYYYYVKAVPKVSLAVPEKTIKKINVREETGEIDIKGTEETEKKDETSAEEKKVKMQQEESEIQKIIEEELKH